MALSIVDRKYIHGRRAAVLLPLCAIAMFAAVSCPAEFSIWVTNSTPSSREVEIHLTNSSEGFFRLSESPDFGESGTSGVVIAINSNVFSQSTGTYADITITYPYGLSGGEVQPFSVANTTSEVRVLGVLFNFSGDSLEVPSYATTSWMHNVLFGETYGWDGRVSPNSFKVFVEQNAYGAATLTGEVYPQWVNINSSAYYRNLVKQPPTNYPTIEDTMAQDIINALDTNLLGHATYDFLIAFGPGCYAAMSRSSYGMDWIGQFQDPRGIFGGFYLQDLALYPNSRLYYAISNELRVSRSASNVLTRYNPTSVTGVWLASDPAHTGVNYYTGGALVRDYAVSSDQTFIRPGTSLPQSNTEVLVTYKPRVPFRVHESAVTAAPPDGVIHSFWFGLLAHEVYHGAGKALALYTNMSVGDLYQEPIELIRGYGLMANGNGNNRRSNTNRLGNTATFKYAEPAYLSGYTRMRMGYVAPFTLQYGFDATVRLFKAEEGDFSDTSDRTKLIKVPLHPCGEDGYFRLTDQTYYRYPVEKKGEEYLLLELRYCGDLENGARNFDAGLPGGTWTGHTGVLIYHVVEGLPGAASHGRDRYNVVRIVDSTPPAPSASLADHISAERNGFYDSPPPFGPYSGVFEYTAAASWNWKTQGQARMHVMLSRSSGTKTLFAQFKDVMQTTVQTASVALDLYTPPSIMYVTAAQTSTNGEGLVTLSTAVSDLNGDRIAVELLYTTNAGISWLTSIVSSVAATMGEAAITNGLGSQVVGVLTSNNFCSITNSLSIVLNTLDGSAPIELSSATKVAARAWDGFAWSDSVLSPPFLVDNQSPPWPIVPVSTSHVIDTWTTNRTFVTAWTSSSDGGGVGLRGYVCIVTNRLLAASIAMPDSPDLQATVSDLSEGSNWWVNLWAVDLRGNRGAVNHAGPYKMDATPPSASAAEVAFVNSPIGGYSVGTIVTGQWTGFDDAMSGIAGYYYSLTPLADPGLGDWTESSSVALPVDLLDETNTLYVWAADRAGLLSGFACDRTLVLDPQSDFDGDGLTSAEEEIAGTRSTDAASSFAMELQGPTASSTNGLIITWHSTSGRVYALHRRDSLTASSPWLVVTNNLVSPPFASTMSYTDRWEGSERRFYRLTVQ